jgi:hypothetical protein
MRSIFLVAVILAFALVVYATDDQFAEFTAVSGSGPPNPKPCNGASNLTPADGTQQPNISTCSDTQLGEIPLAINMPSTIILEPEDGSTIPANKAFNVTTRMINLNSGFFSDPAKQYYSFAQQLDKWGKILGHTHITIQLLSSKTEPPLATVFAFFKGLNEKFDARGTFSQIVEDD